MRMETVAGPAQRFPLAYSYAPLYRADEPNRCPGCGRQHWIVGRMTAECGHCGSALPLENFSTWSAAPRIECRNHQPDELPDHMRPVA